MSNKRFPVYDPKKDGNPFAFILKAANEVRARDRAFRAICLTELRVRQQEQIQKADAAGFWEEFLK